MSTTEITPSAEAYNHKIALEVAKAHFGGRKPTYAEAHHYADEIGFNVLQEAKFRLPVSKWDEAYRASSDSAYYARAAALALYFAK